MNRKSRAEVLQNIWVVLGLTMLSCALWGSAAPFIKLGYKYFSIPADHTFDIIFFAGIRFILAGILTIVFGSIIERKVLVPKRESWFNIVKLCLVQTVLQYFFFYVGLAHTSGAKGAILVGSNTFLTILVSCLVFRMEKLTPRKIIGCILGLAGIVIVNLTGEGLDFSFTLLGEGAVLFTQIMYAVSSVLIKKYSQNENAVTISGYQFFIGGIILSVIGFLCGGRIPQVTGTGICILLYLALVSSVAYTVWGILMKYNPVSRVAIFGFMNPIFGAVLSALLLGEVSQVFNWRSIAALLLVSAGILVVNYVKHTDQGTV